MAKDGWAEMRGKSVDEVDIRDDFMFSYVMRNPAICTQLLEYLLPECKIARIKYIDWDTDETAEEERHMPKMRLAKPEMQKAFFGAAGKRGVRLDAYLDDGKSIYNIELQTSEHIALPQRARLYQAHIDANQLEKGQYYDSMRPSYVIFICTFDPFGKSLYRYSFRNVCREDGTLELRDEAYKLFFNTKGTRGEIANTLREMLTYINNPGAYPVHGSKVELIHRIEEAVEEAKMDIEWREAYMMYQTRIYDAAMEARMKGLREGRAEGREKGLREGRAEGREKGLREGRAEGERKARQEMARTMLKGHLTVEQVMAFTGFSRAEVEELARETGTQG